MNKFVLKILLLMLLMIFRPDQSTGENPGQKTNDRLSANTIAVGHRGAAGLAPENTLAGFARALELGVDAVELDIQLSADGQVVVHHDFYLNRHIARTSNGKWVTRRKAKARSIKELTLSQLKSYDVGRLKPNTNYSRRYPNQVAADGQLIPTLSEGIALIKGYSEKKTCLWIEIKTSPENAASTNPPEPLVDAVLKILKKEDVVQRTRVLSFDWRSLVYLQKVEPAIPTIYLSLMGSRLNNIKPGQPGISPWTAGFDVDNYNGSIPQTVKAAGGSCWSPYYKELTIDSLNEAHKLGLAVSVWVIDEQSSMVRLMAMGVDSITTNRPDILLSVLGKRN